ncbi:hypothetical protein AUP68_11266 [Ilyonectria robusta]
MTINYEGVANIASSDSVDYGLITNPCQGLGSLHAVKACPASSIMAAIVPNAWMAHRGSQSSIGFPKSNELESSHQNRYNSSEVANAVAKDGFNAAGYSVSA